MRTLDVILICVLFPIIQTKIEAKEVKVTGQSQIEWPDNMTRDQIVKQAEELASIDALERAFGRVIVQGNSTYITNIQTGEKAETNSVFNTIANTSVKGEILDVLKKEIFEIKGFKSIAGKLTEVTEIKCVITIIAREIETPPIEFSVFTLGCDNINCQKEIFRNGDDFYLYFSSPVSGYLTIFIDDKLNSSRLLPYRSMSREYESAVPIDADKSYILFSLAQNMFKGVAVDEYKLTTTIPEEMNRLFIIFSKRAFEKPRLENNSNSIELPLQMPSENFQKWLNKTRCYFKDDMQLQIIDITIKQ